MYKNQYIYNKKQYAAFKNCQKGGAADFLNCAKLEYMFVNDNERDVKRKLVYNELYNVTFNKSTDITDLKKHHVKNLFETIDRIYFDSTIKNYIKRNKIKLEYKVSQQLTKTAGMCKKFTETHYQLILSSKIINETFNEKGIKVLKINGIKCFNTLECLLILFEHELVHLIIFLFCPELGEGKGGHTYTFMNIAKNIFGHTDYVHMLLSGDYEEYESNIKDIKNKVKVGSIIKTKPVKGENLLGYVVGMFDKSVKIILKDYRMFSVPYTFIIDISDKEDSEFEKILELKGYVSKKKRKKSGKNKTKRWVN